MHADNQLPTHRRTFACLLLIAVCSSLLPTTAGAAVAASPWLTPGLTIKQLGVVDASLGLEPSTILNRDCIQAEVITRPARLIPPQTKQSHENCIVNTGFGALSESGYLQRPGSDAFGYLYGFNGSTGVVGIPHSNSALSAISSAPNGAYVGFFENLTNLVSTSSFNDTVTHTLPSAPTAIIGDKAGNKLGIDFASLSFSSEGDWAVVEAPGKAMIRIDISSHTVLPFAEAPVGDSGPSYRTAVSADGRYAVVASKPRNLFRLYDLSTCGSITATISGPTTCSSIDLLPSLTHSITSYSSTASVRFRGDYSLEVYVTTASGMERVLVTATGQTPVHFEYLAMGDSFASGEGAYQYKALTDTTANGCHVSLRAYPYLVAKQLKLNQADSVACSGAVIDDLVNTGVDYRLHNSQAKGKSDTSLDEAILTGVLPGYRAQKLFLDRYTPLVTTVSIGGNDIGISDILLRCVGPDTCYSSQEDRLELLNEISNLFNDLSNLYTDLKQRMPESRSIYVVGYPELADPTGNCALNVHLNTSELYLMNTIAETLNDTAKAAAEHAGITFLDTQNALHGYRLCEAVSSKLAVNGLTIGNDILNYPYIHGPIAKESFHPNSLGHELLRTKILELTHDFSVLNSTPKPKTKQPATRTDTPALEVPKTGRSLKKTIHKTGSNAQPAKQGSKHTSTYQGVNHIFKPGSSPTVVLDRGSTAVGTVTRNTDDSITVDLTPLTTTSDGPHTVDIVGDNSSGEPVVITSTIVVSSTTGPCGVFPASGIDADADGIDDACDGMISSTSTAVQTGQTGSPDTSAPSSSDTSPPTNQTPSTTPPATTVVLSGETISPNQDQARPSSAITTGGTANSNSASSPSQPTSSPSVNTVTTGPQVKAEHTNSNATPVSANPSPKSRDPRRLDFLRVRTLLWILIIIFLIVCYVIYKKRKDNQWKH